MHRAWPASRLVTVTGADRHGIHGAYGDTCVDGTVNAYLRTGKPPGSDVTRAAGHAGAAERAPAWGGEPVVLTASWCRPAAP
ncbi:alpha/beta hydrolase [Streptomyces sp. NPDC005486]|uniref:alpha/beta hydrolase n=1 Tax=Streptomyces sp. NPDC005486 TaxID=3155345 RepID=UPI0033BF1A11